MYKISPSKTYGVVYLTTSSAANTAEFITAYRRAMDWFGYNANSADLEDIFRKAQGSCYYIRSGAVMGAAYKVSYITNTTSRNGVIVALSVEVMQKIVEMLPLATVDNIALRTTQFFNSTSVGPAFGLGVNVPMTQEMIWNMLEQHMVKKLDGGTLLAKKILPMTEQHARVKTAASKIITRHWDKLGLKYE